MSNFHLFASFIADVITSFELGSKPKPESKPEPKSVKSKPGNLGSKYKSKTQMVNVDCIIPITQKPS